MKGIPRQKQMHSYPAVLIGRLGVHKDYRNIEGEEDNIGKQLMDFIKSWFIDGKNGTLSSPIDFYILLAVFCFCPIPPIESNNCVLSIH